MTYFILHNITHLCMFTAHANSEAEALNEYAGWRSGYETFGEMRASPTFRPFTNVYAARVKEDWS